MAPDFAPPTPRADPPPAAAHARRAAVRGGFSLTELLVVIGIIVLVAVIAVPSFRAMSGGRSTEAAQNTIASVLARARTEALGLQEVRGVMFYRDQETQRVAMLPVMPTTTAPPWALDLVPDRDAVLLPPGVGIQFVDNYASTGSPPVRNDDGYVGFNTVVNTELSTVVPYGGVILFDGQGQLVSDPYSFRFVHTATTPTAAEMGRFLMNNPSLPVTTDPIADPAPAAEGKIGFVLFDAEEFANGVASDDTDTQVAGGTYATTERGEEVWLDENALPVLVNRFNGTLLRGE